MQDDSQQTFGEICGTHEALLEAIEEAISTAIVQENEDEPLHLRFITPQGPLEHWYTDKTWCDYRITQTHEHVPNMEYISISYCWKHSQNLDELLKLPECRIWDAPGHEGPRPVNCPNIVFHRAVQYARDRRCPYIWIDQECINQDDEMDIETHLKIMHRVYSESCWTAAILSVNAPSGPALDKLVDFFYAEVNDPHIWYSEELIQEWLEKHVHAVGVLNKDPWFSRTWAYQEKLCATTLQLLVPLGPNPNIPDKYLGYISGTDLVLDSNSAQERLRVAKYRYLEDYPSGGILLKYASRRFYGDCRTISENPLEVCEIFQQMYNCNNAVVSDRLAILANVLGLRKRLLSNRLDHPKYSLSICVLALVLLQEFSDRWERQWLIFSEEFAYMMNWRVEDVFLSDNLAIFKLLLDNGSNFIEDVEQDYLPLEEAEPSHTYIEDLDPDYLPVEDPLERYTLCRPSWKISQK